ncbi:class I SAM-dependent methyltransferase [Kitasatospora sp. NPDC049285]|uniref:class I SAM-dependent methyltransferase n=1 Tax=Kitasatospora sp. NPDC049285 TaxID=3157096 RepID=UPI003430BAE1
MEFAEFERRGWATRSGGYDGGFGAMTAGVHGRLLEAAGVGAGTRLLEVGCGTGRLAALALGLGAELTATDAAVEMVRATAAGLPGVTVCQAVLPGLPFRAGEFEAAVGAFVINHVPDPAGAVADLHRVLEPGGRVVLSCWDTLAANRAQGIFFDAFEQSGAVRPTGLPSAPFAAHATPEGLAALLAGAGFAEVRVEPVRWLHRVDPEQWWHDVRSGTVLTSALIEGQPPATVERIHAAYHRLAAAHPEGFPAAALVATGVRP